jgi:DNA repair protein RadC
MPLSIVEENGRIVVTSPYHPNFPARARGLGGSWDPVRRVWLFAAGDHERVKSLCHEIYGTDGTGYGTLPNAMERSANRNQLADGVPAVPHYYGHRNRLRQRLIDAGAENLPDYELLEMLLFAASQRGDVKPLAKALLAQFGGFAEVMSADADALGAAGLNLAGIAAVKSVREAALRLMRAELQEQPVINTWDKLIDYCTAQVAHNKVEEFHILFLDRKNVLLKHERQQKGTVDHTPVYTREVVKRALELGASALILVHNHPSGDPTPSKADIAVTQDIKKAAAPLGVVLHDHVIIGRNRHTSLRDLGLI